jgi:thiamine biosynthesis lipoprotein
MRISTIVLLFFLILTFLSACADTPKQIQLNGSTMGTQYHITMVVPVDGTEALLQKMKPEIEALFSQINQQMSTYKSDSQISRFNQNYKTDWFTISSDFAVVVKAAQQVSAISNGALDITIAPLVDLWGFGPKTINVTPTNEQIEGKLAHIGYHLLEVRLDPPALRKRDKQIHIDLSAIAKGFAVDKVSAYLKQKGLDNFLVEIGGEISSRGLNAAGKKWRIAIESPDRNKVNKVVEISGLSLATSGDYRNYFIKDGVRLSHTISPKTGYPIKHKLASVTVLHDSTMMADAYATALMVLGETKGKDFALKQQLKINLIIREDKNYKSWSNLPETLN